MDSADEGEQILKGIKGSKPGLDEALPLVYRELRSLAQRYLSAERREHTLQPTALVHEAYLRLVDQRQMDWGNRAQVLGVAAQMMRRILINHAEKRNAQKREGYANAITLTDAMEPASHDEFDLLALNTAIDKLSEFDDQQARIVEMRFFGGLTVDETAENLGVSPATVKRDWSMARAWLMRELSGAA